MLADLTPPQLALAEFMSELSESAYCAGWMDGLEYALWEVVHGQRSTYGQLMITDDMRSRLIALGRACGGWIVFDDSTEETWLPEEVWKQRFARARHVGLDDFEAV